MYISRGVGTSEVCQAMECPGGLALALSLLAGMGTSAGVVETGVHNITTHNGGRTAGMWADAPR